MDKLIRHFADKEGTATYRCTEVPREVTLSWGIEYDIPDAPTCKHEDGTEHIMEEVK